MAHPTTAPRLNRVVLSGPIPGVWNIYHAPKFCSSIPVQIAMELGLVEANKVVIHAIPYDSIWESHVVLKADPVLGKLSPSRKLPVAVLPDGSTMCEAGAIAHAILENFDKSGILHPVSEKIDISATRAQHLQGVVYAVTEGFPSVRNVFRLGFGVPKEKRDNTAIAEIKRTSFKPVVEEHLARILADGRGYYLGEKFSAADVCFRYILLVASMCDADLVGHPIVAGYQLRLAARKSFKELFHT
jgi:glutathione S-transferase